MPASDPTTRNLVKVFISAELPPLCMVDVAAVSAAAQLLLWLSVVVGFGCSLLLWLAVAAVVVVGVLSRVCRLAGRCDCF
jgi:hypothetical protein